MRDRSSWVGRPAPSLRIVDEDLWRAAHVRLNASRAVYLETGGKACGRLANAAESACLLSGLLRCARCVAAHIGTQAIVIGAGMAGLTAARAVSDYFDGVLVLERDSLLTEATHRAGIPQGWHVHALLAGGERALETLFPGFADDLKAIGAVPLQAGRDVRTERA